MPAIDYDEETETTTEKIKASKNEHGFTFKGIIKYKLKKAKKTWNQLKDLILSTELM